MAPGRQTERRQTERRQAEQRQTILDAAAGAIAARGFHGMSMRELAAASGKGLSSLYHYFPSKEEILFALQKEAFETLIAATREVLAGIEVPTARLYAFIAQHVHYFARHPDLMRVLVHEAGSLPEGRRRVLRRLKEQYFGIGRRIVEDLITEGCARVGKDGAPLPDEAELERSAYALFGMLNWVYGWYEPERHGSPVEVTRTLHRLALCGLVTQCPFRAVEDHVDELLLSLAQPPPAGDARAAGELR